MESSKANDHGLSARFRYSLEELIGHSPTEPILVAVSGGLDSMVMATLLLQAGYRFSVAHCNFALRGRESAEDEVWIERWCQASQIPFYSKQFDTHEYAIGHRISIQMAARRLRYTWFEELCSENNFLAYAVGHHKNDVVETILMNLVRGTGLAGLRGILPRNGRIIRPLLPFSRTELEAEAQRLAIGYREDRSNLSRKYLRNRIRMDVIPILKELNPGLEHTIDQHTRQLQLTEYLAKTKLRELKARLWTQEGIRNSLNLSQLRSIGPFAPELLYGWMRGYGFSYATCKEIMAERRQETGKLFFSKKYALILNRNHLCLEPIDPSMPVFGSFAEEIKPATQNVQSITHQAKEILLGGLDRTKGPIEERALWDTRFSETWIEDPYEVQRIKTEISGKLYPDINTVFLNADQIQGSISTRSWKTGDSFIPLGMKNRKKMSDFFVDSKVSRLDKHRIPLVIDEQSIIWVAGLRLHDGYKITKDSTRILALQYFPETFGRSSDVAQDFTPGE